MFTMWSDNVVIRMTALISKWYYTLKKSKLPFFLKALKQLEENPCFLIYNNPERYGNYQLLSKVVTGSVLLFLMLQQTE